jgi:NAD(P)-dependent dehydrogenase (short-subunit alcohol dehydrogenase family)
MQLSGRTALISGASRGFGVGIAEKFVAEGASLIICARSVEKLEAVANSLREKCHPGQRVAAIPSDISVVDQVDALFEKIGAQFGDLDILVNNAASFGPMGNLLDVPWERWIETINVNLLGTTYMCRKAIPFLRLSERGKIINISGGGAARPLPALGAYSVSKAAILRFTEDLAEASGEAGIDVNSVAPGPLDTRFVDEAIEAGVQNLGEALYQKILEIRRSGGTSFTPGVDLCSFLGSRESDTITGKALSAQFDDWLGFRHRLEELNTTDVFTMRRLDPATLAKMKHVSAVSAFETK